MAAVYARNITQSKELLDKLYALLPAGQMQVENVNRVIELKSGPGFCLVKDVSKTPVTIQDYNKSKGMLAFQANTAKTDSLALVHFMPENIIKRMKYEAVSDKKQQEDAEQTDE